MKLFNSIKLDNRKFEGESLKLQINSRLNNKSTPDWEKEIYGFIKELTNDKNYIVANSSGTTGKAKPIQLKKTDLIDSALRTQSYFNLSPADNGLLCLPASYIAGKMMIVRAFVIGFNLIYVEPTSNPVKEISMHIDFAALTPFQLSASIGEKNLSSIKYMIVGGAQVSNELNKSIQNIHTMVFETYGMTETCSHIAIKPLNGQLKSEYFKILPGFQVSKDKRECLVITQNNGTILTTNDIVELEEDKFKWLGRYDNVINSGGIKLFPEQIEKKLEPILSHKFLIIPEKHSALGEQVVLLVEWPQKKSDFELKQFISKLNGVLSSFERPKKLYLLPEFIETSSGKIQRKETMASIKGKTGYEL